MDLKNILNEGSSHQARLSETTRALASKWEKTGLLEGIGNASFFNVVVNTF